MFSENRNELRQVFFDSWYKYQNKLSLQSVEAQLIEIILIHPEYHELLNDLDNLHQEQFDFENPFLHLSLHLAIREQVSTNRPEGISAVHQALCKKLQDVHLVEHRMMECLGNILWNAQRDKRLPDEKGYLEELNLI